jgi:hypothetical protein
MLARFAIGRPLREVEEVRRTEDREHARLDRRPHVLAGSDLALGEGRVSLELARPERTAKRALGEPREAGAGSSDVDRRARQVAVALELRVRDERPFPLDPVEHQHRVDGCAGLVLHLQLPRQPAFLDAEERPAGTAEAREQQRAGDVVGRGELVLPDREVRVELDDDRLVFRRDDVPFEQQAVYSGRVDDEVRRAAEARPQSAHLRADPVPARTSDPDTGWLRADALPGPQVDPDLVRATRALELAEPLGAVGARTTDQIDGGAPDDDRIRRRVGVCLGEDRLGCREVLLDVRRGQREHGSDALEPVPDVVRVQPGPIGDVEVHAQKIVDRVRILLARQAVERDAPALRETRRISLPDPCREPCDDSSALLRRRAIRLVLRRHLGGVDPFDHLEPTIDRRPVREVAGQVVDPEPGSLLRLAVAAEAVPPKVREDVLIEARRRFGRPRREIRAATGREHRGHGE